MENQPQQNNNPMVHPTPPPVAEGKPLAPLRVGIISTECNKENLMGVREELLAVNNKLQGRVELIVFGHYSDEKDGNWLEGVNFEFIKPVSIIHYMQQLKSLNLDLLFIPLEKTVYNATSENYNKFCEAALFDIPILTLSIFPYNKTIIDKRNGFLYKEK